MQPFFIATGCIMPVMSSMNKLLPFFGALFLFFCCVTHQRAAVSDTDVRFTLYAPGATSVAIAGSFNRWDPLRSALSGPDRSGQWSITLHLPPGRHEYLFVINGETWLPDPNAPAIDDGFGGRNSIVSVEK